MGLSELFSERGLSVILQQIDIGYDEWYTRLENHALVVADVLDVTFPKEKGRQARDKEEKESSEYENEFDPFFFSFPEPITFFSKNKKAAYNNTPPISTQKPQNQPE